MRRMIVEWACPHLRSRQTAQLREHPIGSLAPRPRIARALDPYAVRSAPKGFALGRYFVWTARRG